MTPSLNIFISYSSNNNGERWVSKFRDRLYLALLDKIKNRPPPFSLTVWMDRRDLSETHPITEQLVQAVSAADIYVAIHSHQYLNSPWCRQEREIFLSRWKTDLNGRLVMVRYSHVPLDDPAVPGEFKSLLGHKFYAEDEDGFSDTLEDDGENAAEYRKRVRKVAWDIAKNLATFDSRLKVAPFYSLNPPISNDEPHAFQASVLVVAPKDMSLEGRLVQDLLARVNRVGVEGQNVRIVPASLTDILARDGPWARPSLRGLRLLVLVIWSELGELTDEKNPTAGTPPLAEAMIQLAMEQGAHILILRCNRNLSLRPDDPLWEKKVTELRMVHKFCASYTDDSKPTSRCRQFITPDELATEFDGGLKEAIAAAVKEAQREIQMRPPGEDHVQSAETAGMVGNFESYLRWVVEKHEKLELRGIGGTTTLASIPLEEVYVALRGVRASEHERQQSRNLYQKELLTLVRAWPECVSPAQFAQLIEEAEDHALISNPLMPAMAERDRGDTEEIQSPEITMSLGEAFRTERWLVVLGDPGSGKTTLLRWIARKLAVSMLAGPDGHVVVPAYHIDPSVARTDDRTVDLGPTRLPVLVRISEYSDALQKARRDGTSLPLIDFVGHQTWQGDKLKIPQSQLNALIKSFLRQGRAVILLDGMDEVTASSQRDHVVHAIELFIQDWVNLRGEGLTSDRTSGWDARRHGTPAERGGNQIVITSRIAGYHASPIAGPISHMTVQPMQRRAVEHFCDAWTLAVHRQSASAEKQNMENDARVEAEGLKAEIFNPKNPQVWELARNPLLITILALIYRKTKKKLPRQRTELYHAALLILIENWRAVDITSEELIYVLAPLAERIHSNYSTGLIRESEMREIITRELARYRQQSPDNPPPSFDREVKSFLRRMEEDVGLIAKRSQTLYGFLHLTFQEYLAALYLVRDRGTAGQMIVDRLDQPRWREPILLALGHVGSNSDWGPLRTERLLRQILKADDPLGELVPRGPLLVVRALPELENIADSLVEELLDLLLRSYSSTIRNGLANAVSVHIEKALNTLYHSRHQKQLISSLARLLHSGEPQVAGQMMACANLIRTNGWMPLELAGPLLRAQFYDNVQWMLPFTHIVCRMIAPPSLAVQTKLEADVDKLAKSVKAMRDSDRERLLEAEIAELEKRVAPNAQALK